MATWRGLGFVPCGIRARTGSLIDDDARVRSLVTLVVLVAALTLAAGASARMVRRPGRSPGSVTLEWVGDMAMSSEAERVRGAHACRGRPDRCAAAGMTFCACATRSDVEWCDSDSPPDLSLIRSSRAAATSWGCTARALGVQVSDS
jgi:hypothetical protein